MSINFVIHCTFSSTYGVYVVAVLISACCCMGCVGTCAVDTDALVGVYENVSAGFSLGEFRTFSRL